MQNKAYFCTILSQTYFIMLIQFSVKNFRTFKYKATLSMVASNYDKDTRESENIHFDTITNLRLLKSAVVYGANASGKSKLFDAFMFMKQFIITSSKYSLKGDTIDVIPFRLNSDSEESPSEFEVIFVHNNKIFRYGFEANSKMIISEWLFYKPKTKEIELFYRDKNNFDTHDRNFPKGNAVIREGLVRDNALLVSVAAQFNDGISTQVIDWFKNLKVISGLNELGYHGFTMIKTEDPIHKKRILELLKVADLGIQDIKLQKLEFEKLPKEMPLALKEKIMKEMNEEQASFIFDVTTMHKKYDTNTETFSNSYFSMFDDESEGTKKFFALAGPILEALENGFSLIIDELDSKLHPNLVCKIIALFNSKEWNKKNAQLIFNTHDTNLLSSGLFRRDQIWFTEKNKYGEAKLYSLADFKSDDVRKNESFEENYIRGKYGAVPFLSFFDNLKNLVPAYENEG